MNPSQYPYKNNMKNYLKNPRVNLTGRIKIPEVRDGGGPLEQAPARENGYHPTLDSHHIKGKSIKSRY